MIYIYPHYKKEEEKIKKIKGISRLFAYPKEPHFENQGEKIILDSGAYGLSLTRKKMNLNYMKKLSLHYEKYYKENVICVAPDEFLNPYQSMHNWNKWHKEGLFKNISPVLQCSKKEVIDTKELLEQIKFYRKYNPKNWLFSNNFMTGEIARSTELYKIFDFMKNKLNIEWIHILGAGWSLEDIKDWKSIGNFNSMDSIAYYTTNNINEFGSLNAIDNIKKIEVLMNEKP